MEELRRILFEPEQQKLSGLEKRLDDPVLHAEELSRVLPQAVARSVKIDDGLAQALSPVVEGALKRSVRRNPRVLADAIFPAIGPAIRKALTDAFVRMLQTFNHALENSLSWRGLAWRLEARRTGRPFAEVVLCHTLVYRVEQVFLVHQPSGLMLQHVAAPEVTSNGEEVISGMISAINSFVREAFGSGEGDGLNSIRVGELDVWVESGPSATLAAVIRGRAPERLRQTLVDTLEGIHRAEGELLEGFQGDTDMFEPVRPRLEECLQAQFNEKQERGSPLKLIFVAVAVVALLLAWAVTEWHARSRWQDYVSALRAEPGLVITDARKEGRVYRISGLKDPMARDPVAIAGGMGLDESKVESRLEPFLALNPILVLRRARARLAPPPGVELSLEDGVLVIRGRAPEHWWREVEPVARTLAGIERVDLAELRWTPTPIGER